MRLRIDCLRPSKRPKTPACPVSLPRIMNTVFSPCLPVSLSPCLDLLRTEQLQPLIDLAGVVATVDVQLAAAVDDPHLGGDAGAITDGDLVGGIGLDLCLPVELATGQRLHGRPALAHHRPGVDHLAERVRRRLGGRRLDGYTMSHPTRIHDHTRKEPAAQAIAIAAGGMSSVFTAPSPRFSCQCVIKSLMPTLIRSLTAPAV